jgi:NAD(P)H-dependent FMN reductase
MKRILGISGSLRKRSFNTALLRAAESRFHPLIEIGDISQIPLYNADIESNAMPEPVLQLKSRLMDAGGLLLVTPEYNSSVPGVLKNAVDWLSRPSLDVSNVFHGKPVAVIGASPGGFGTIMAQSAWLQVFHGMGGRFFSARRLMVSGASRAFDEHGNLTDETLTERLDQFIRAFRDFCAV